MSDLEQNATKKVEPVQVPLPTGTTILNPPIDKNKRRRGTDGPVSKAFNNEARDHLSAQIARLFYAAGGLKITHLFIAWLIHSIQGITVNNGLINLQIEVRVSMTPLIGSYKITKLHVATP
ncbi:hypothetical protein P8452_70726 [Trifolium repens]|nr:hypothetical protein P8452_70726 [Trifolium repens]